MEERGLKVVENNIRCRKRRRRRRTRSRSERYDSCGSRDGGDSGNNGGGGEGNMETWTSILCLAWLCITRLLALVTYSVLQEWT